MATLKAGTPIASYLVPIGSLTEPTGRPGGLSPDRAKRLADALKALTAARVRALVESRNFVIGGGR